MSNSQMFRQHTILTNDLVISFAVEFERVARMLFTFLFKLLSNVVTFSTDAMKKREICGYLAKTFIFMYSFIKRTTDLIFLVD
jgi:hypothetical protein